MANRRARELRAQMTDAERTLWRELRRRRLGARFRRQVPFGPYIADFASFEHRLVIEVDGGQHADQEGYDAMRSDFLESQGYRVLRFWNNEVLGNIDGVLLEIARALVADPPPQPSPARGEGA
jgi:very-short-patch-repair endonuclease